MKRLLFFCLLLLMSICLPAQSGRFNLVLGAGPGYFFNDPSLSRYVNHSWLIGLHYLNPKKDRAFYFNPGLYLQADKYRSGIMPRRFAHITQKSVSGHLDVLLRLNKKMFLRAGIYGNLVYRQTLDITDKTVNGKYYYGWSNDSLYTSYHGTHLQAGVTLGLCFRLRLFNREQLIGIQVNQMASPLVNHDFMLNQTLVGQTTQVLSTKTLPTLLLFTLEWNLRKREKKKEEDD